MLEVSLERTTLTDFCFCLAGPPTVSFHTKARKNKKTRAHLVIDRLGLGGGLGKKLFID